MNIGPGTILGRYEIRAKLGEGGMGEVYLAQDTKLDRKVALKILPAELASHRDRMERFVREAKTAAALNHLNIATIHEIGEADGTHFIAMELVEGQTLRHVIHENQTDLPKLLRYLQHTAEGLAKAHAAGIVHRDLKPDNIMITRDGNAKILDFGLAKLTERRGDRETRRWGDEADTLLAVSPRPPVSPSVTFAGLVLGTVGYMSPEQAQGKTNEIDHRSDIFSFGCILYEAITRHKAFEGKDAIDSLNRIIRETVTPISEFRPDVPNHLQRIVRRCLAKDPDERYQTIKDVALELKELRHEMKQPADFDTTTPPSATAISSSAHTSSLSAATEAPASASSAEYLFKEIKAHKREALLAVAALIVLAGSVSFGLYRYFRRRSAIGLRPLKIMRLTSTGQVNHAAISPDGKYVVYVRNEGDKESLWMTQVAASSNVQIVPPAEVHYHGITLSHDGNFIYYVRLDKDNPEGALYQTPAFGGNARKLLINIYSPISLSPDDKHLAFVRCDGCLRLGVNPGESDLIVANADGSDEKKLAAYQRPSLFSIGGPAWSPDGSVIACGSTHRTAQEGGPYRNVIALRVSDGKEQPVTSQRWRGSGVTNMRITWLADGSGIFVSGVEQGNLSQIWYLSWPGDEARNVSNDLSDYVDLSITSDSGTLATVRSDRVINLWIIQNGDAAAARRITSGAERADGERGISWTPEGKIVYCSTAGGKENIWITRPDGAENKQLSSGPLQNIEPVVSPDGRYILWAAQFSGRWELWRMNVDGTDPKNLTNGGYYQDVSRDGMWVIYSPPNANLWKVPIDGGTPTRMTDASVLRPVISPDGQSIACMYQAETLGIQVSSWQTKIGIFPIGGGSVTKSFDIPAPRGDFKWTPDGRAIAYVRTISGISNIWAQPIDGGPPKQLTNFQSERIFNFAWSRDGQQLAISRGVVNKDVVLITGFK